MNLDIIPNGAIKRVHVSQNDVGRTLTFELFNNSTSYTVPSGATVKIQGTKPSGFGFSEVCTVSGNVATIDTTEAMTDESGNIQTELSISYDDVVIGTSNFVLAVEKNPHPDTTTDGSMETIIPELTLLVNEVKGYAEEIEGTYHAYGSPWVASTVAQMTDTDKIYVYVGSESGYTNGNWYYYNGSAWVSGGVYNAVAVQTDTTLSVSGMPADAKVVGDVLNPIYEQYINESYSSALPVTRESVSISTGSFGIAIPNDTSLVKTFETGKTYFAYAELTISNLTNYATGNAYLQYAYLVSQPPVTEKYAGTNAQPIANGKIVLYGFFTSVATGQARPTISFRNTSTAYSLSLTLNKLFLIETDVDLSDILAETDNCETIVNFTLPNNVVTYNNLDSDLQEMIASTADKTIIDCWGDSLTAGAGSTNYPYPTKLQELIGSSVTVNNYGQGSETAEAIAFRQGGMKAIVDPFSIDTSSGTTAYITDKAINGASLDTLNLQGTYYGNDRVYIDNNPFMFRRSGSGQYYVALLGATSSVHSYDRPQLMVAEGKGKNHVILICLGENGWVNSDGNTLADIIQGMIEYNEADEYLVLGRPTGTAESRSALEAVLGSRFSEHFVNLREYISAYGLSDNNLTATDEDTDAMEIGAIPPQLRSDNTHMNDYGYIAMANCIYQRGLSLGYWE